MMVVAGPSTADAGCDQLRMSAGHAAVTCGQLPAFSYVNADIKLSPDDSQSPSASVAQPQDLTAMAQRLPLRILVAEDNPINVKLIKIVLCGLGYRPDVAGNGLEVLSALRRQHYDLVLMDVRMPKMDGIEATRRICQEWQPGQRPRIVALTAGVMPEERHACLDAGADDFLLKPAVRAELIQALERCRAKQQ